MKNLYRTLSACALLALASCASNLTPTETAATAAPTPTPPPRETFRKDVVIHSQPEGAAIYINNSTLFVGNAPVTVTYPAYVDNGEFVHPHQIIKAIPTEPGQFTQDMLFTFSSSTSYCTLFMYNTER